MDNAITLRRGQSYTRRYTVQLDGQPYNLTGRDLHFRLFDKFGQVDEDQLVAYDSPSARLVVIDAVGGVFDLDILAVDMDHDPKSYTYSLWTTLGADKKPLVVDKFVVQHPGYP